MIIDAYDWAGGREAMIRFGPSTGPVAVAALPLFEEANRTRAFVVAILRGLARRGIAGALPDLPGTGESLMSLAELSLLRVCEGYEGAVGALLDRGQRCYGLGVRSGALLDGLGLLQGRWHLAPQSGADVLRELKRIKQAELGRPLRGDPWFFDDAFAEDVPIDVGGTALSTDLLTDLAAYEPFDQPGIVRRVVRLGDDPRPADRHVAGAPLWRRAEPGNDPELAELLAEDIAQWVRTCEG